jgi:hypothetical protein
MLDLCVRITSVTYNPLVFFSVRSWETSNLGVNVLLQLIRSGDCITSFQSPTISIVSMLTTHEHIIEQDFGTSL